MISPLTIDETPSRSTPSAAGGHMQLVVSPSRARTGWVLLVCGLFLMICGGDQHFCESFANRKRDAPNQAEPYPVVPMWPPTLSSMSADITTPAGRFFFVFMLLGGTFVVQSNILIVSFAHDGFPGNSRIYYLSLALCLGTILVGMCPTQIVSKSVVNNPLIKRMKYSTYIHLGGAFCAFVLLPASELYMAIRHSCRCRKRRYLVQTVCSILGLVLFVLFQMFNLFASNEYTNQYLATDSCRGGKHANECREQYLNWLNFAGFWMEYACASCSIALLGVRIFSVDNQVVQEFTAKPGWVLQLDTAKSSPHYLGALIFQLSATVVSMLVMNHHWEHQSTLCCACTGIGDRCIAIYQNIDNGTAVCTASSLTLL
eukprot:TRINITY_DN100546_c0_g1_i1.p1 TRINITY_DN100546_c0_g1~~TRINITY_DN100546_c0_g1_i1.p1  ORF type:complete len:372 (-),score=44.88 TRINITY_DN100546_c0_g1_i1:135-1250(-)